MVRVRATSANPILAIRAWVSINESARIAHPHRHSSHASLPPLSLYVHLPWCVRKCPYCNFNSHAVRGGANSGDDFSRRRHEVSPAPLGTYAYVNPAVAMVLGRWWLGETLDAVQLAGMVVILLGVVLVTTRARRA